jgi:predicted TIM-barrel fold metal-dependent hydrolase
MGEFKFLDAERHYYEPDDCWTRHLESKYAARSVHAVREADGTGTWFFGDTPLTKARRIYTKMLAPGSYGLMARSGEEDDQPEQPSVDALSPEFSNRERFIQVMDEQNVEAALVQPSHALDVPYDMRHDPEAAHANLRSLNRWMDEEWGFDYQGRIFATPFFVLYDVDQAAAELDRVIAAGARAVILQTGPVLGHSPAEKMFDPFWARINEAKIPVIFHIDYGGYTDFFSSAWGYVATPTEAQVNAFQWLTCSGARPVQDMIASLVLHNLFGRFPNVNVMSVSNGSLWMRDLQRLDAFTSPAFPWARDEQTWWPGGRLTATPTELMQEHVYVAPFAWDNIEEVVQLVPASRLIMATDYPHPDGFSVAAEYETLLKGLTPEDMKSVMRDNLRQLLFT